jgi:hypothetical protein
MRPIDDIACETAERLVKVEEYHTSNSHYVCLDDGDDGEMWTPLYTKDAAERIAGRSKALVAAVILAAVREALECPAESPVSAARLAEVRKADAVRRKCRGVWQSTHPLRGDWVPDLLAHIDYLQRAYAHLVHAVSGPEGAAYFEGFEAGRREGARRQREADIMFVLACPDVPVAFDDTVEWLRKQSLVTEEQP